MAVTKVSPEPTCETCYEGIL